MAIRILDSAEQDLIDGYRFYARQGHGIGGYFIDSLFSDIDSLQLYAGIHPVQFGYYKLLSKRFPFAIYYKLDGTNVDVWAIIDCRQNPVNIATRLGFS